LRKELPEAFSSVHRKCHNVYICSRLGGETLNGRLNPMPQMVLALMAPADAAM
jgi:hypothetical protein